MAETVDTCDHTSVGVLIVDPEERVLLIEREKYPFGMAAPAGHMDPEDGGDPERAALREVREETGLIIAAGGLVRTSIEGRRVSNNCRRNGQYHNWWVYTTTDYEGDLDPKVDEAKNAGWYDRQALQDLAQRTHAYEAGRIAEDDWVKNPGLEDVWLKFVLELKFIDPWPNRKF